MNWIASDEHIWHPFTQHAIDKNTIGIVSGKDTLLFDIDNNIYIDAISSWWVNLFGHCNETIAAAIFSQTQKLEHTIFAGFTHEPACKLASKLIDILPNNFDKVFFSDNGSTSVEVALKMAIQYWHNKCIKKTKIIAFENAYHGDTFGAMSVGKSAFFAAFDNWLFEVIKIPIPTHDNIDNVIDLFTTHVSTNDVVCFIFEPLILGSAGMQMYDAKYLDLMIDIAHKHEVICIADEVMTGFGRTGKKFAIEYLCQPIDIICLSKGITGGFLPLGVTICNTAIYDAFYSEDKMKTFFHGHSYTANPISCAAACASIDLLNTYQDRIHALCKLQNDFLLSLSNNPIVKNIRRTGTIVAFEVNSEYENYFDNIKQKLYIKFLNEGVLLRPLGNTVYIMPPYCIQKEELEKIYSVIEKVLNEIN